MKLTVIGVGRLGLCTALCFEKAGHSVLGVDVFPDYVDSLNKKEFRSPEPYVNKMLQSSHNISFTTSLNEGLEYSDIYFIVVDTPLGGGKNFYDHSKLSKLLIDINKHNVQNKTIVICCTVMPGYIDRIGKLLIKNCNNTTLNYNPEFIAQGEIVKGFTQPDMVLIGSEDDKTGQLIKDMYDGVVTSEPQWCIMRPLEAEIVKISLNGFVTTKIAYANTIGDLCQSFSQPDTHDNDSKLFSNPKYPRPNVVLHAIGCDSRVGNKYFRHGPSFGGPCFPRDTKALSQVLRQQDVYSTVIDATTEANTQHVEFQAERLGEFPEHFTVHQGSYKGKVPIVHESFSLRLAEKLCDEFSRHVVVKDQKNIIDLVKMEYGDKFEYVVEEEKSSQPIKKAVVFGAGGFIGSHLVKRLKREGYYVIGVDLKKPEFCPTHADKFYVYDLRDESRYSEIIPENCDELYQLAADMGGATYVFTGEHDADIMANSAMINILTCKYSVKKNVGKVFYSSSACIYNEDNQLDPSNPICHEASAYPAGPDSEYGWEKLFSERLYLSYHRNYGLQVRIARFHNVTGEEGTWEGGKEKAPAAICRKVAMAEDGSSIEIFGDGKQTRSFLYINECLEGVRRLMNSDFTGPVNIGSDESVEINELARIVIKQSGKDLTLTHIDGPLGVRGRTSDNTLIMEKLNWAPDCPLTETIANLYPWVKEQVDMKTKN